MIKNFIGQFVDLTLTGTLLGSVGSTNLFGLGGATQALISGGFLGRTAGRFLKL